MPFSCIPYPENAKALGYYLLHQSSPREFASLNRRYTENFERAYGPVDSAMRTGTYKNLYAQHNPKTHRENERLELIESLKIQKPTSKKDTIEIATKSTSTNSDQIKLIGESNDEVINSIYSKVSIEISESRFDIGLLARCNFDADGNEKKKMRLYTERRVNQYVIEWNKKKVEAKQADLDRQEALQTENSKLIIAIEDEIKNVENKMVMDELDNSIDEFYKTLNLKSNHKYSIIKFAILIIPISSFLAAGIKHSWDYFPITCIVELIILFFVILISSDSKLLKLRRLGPGIQNHYSTISNLSNYGDARAKQIMVRLLALSKSADFKEAIKHPL